MSAVNRPPRIATNGADASARPQIGPNFSAWYNLCRRQEGIKGDTPVMAAGITGKVWSIRELLEQAAEI